MRVNRRVVGLLAPGLVAFVVAALSVADMFLPRPYDGVVLEPDAPQARVVRQVVAGSGADRAGISPGDVIVGIDRSFVKSNAHAQRLLNQHKYGDRVPYLVRSGGRIFETEVELGRRRVGDLAYLVACVLGLVFFLVGSFVVVRQPRLPASRVFASMCSLFLLFLVCRLRPASYSWVDTFVLTTGTVALLFLPASFLHFFLIFPRPIWEWREDFISRLLRFVAQRSPKLLPIYLLPPMVYVATVLEAKATHSSLALISGAPAANWWVMVGYMLLGLGALYLSSRHLPEVQQRRGAGLVFAGTLFGVVPFTLLAVAFPSFLHTERFLMYGVVPLVLVPITFAYAIVRYQLLDIRVILRKSLLYTVTTALVTAVYALGIASFNLLFRGTTLAASPYFPVVFALAIVLLFEPLRHRIQGPVDRFFFAERLRLQKAMVEMGDAFTREVDISPVVTQLVERLPGLLRVHFAALYMIEDNHLRRVAGPGELPEFLPSLGIVYEHLKRRGGLVRVDELAPLRLLSGAVDGLGRDLVGAGVEVVGLVASTRRSVGLMVLSASTRQTTLEREELQLVRGLLNQASIALETSLLLEERTHQAELERELKIAAAIQSSLLPKQLGSRGGWDLAAVCRPAREVGGDFFTELPAGADGTRAIAYGDVSGKSISGALMMMAAHEVLHSLALAHPDPEELLRLANARLHSLRRRGYGLRGGSFVALAYLAFLPTSGTIRYSLAGQPPPLIRRGSGAVDEVRMPSHRLPLGAFRVGGHQLLETALAPEDLLIGYSDGVVDARDPSGEAFGEQRLHSTLCDCPGEPEGAVAWLLESLEGFTRGHVPYDDVTIVAARWRG